MNNRSSDFDIYMGKIDTRQRAALEKIRKAIHQAAPGAEECISYGMPAFRLNGRVLVAIGATAKHCAFYPMSGSMVEAFSEQLDDFDTSKGTIRFQPDKPLPASLVRQIVKARLAEIAGSNG